MRRKYLRVGADFIPGILRGGFEPTEPIPPDLKVVDISFERWTSCFLIEMESESFDLVADGRLVPEWRLAFRRSG